MIRLFASFMAAAVSAAVFGACRGASSNQQQDLPNVEEQVGFGGDVGEQRQADAENLIRDCMKAQGFEYVPLDPAAQRAALVGSQGLSELDFEKQYGYGITTLYEQRQQQAVTGPNEKIRNSLSESEKVSYDRTLYGDDPTATLAVALDNGDFTHLGGCVKQATEKVFGGTEFLNNLTAKLDDLDERILQDPRMVDAMKKWSACMRADGYALPNQDEVDVVLKERLDSIVGPPENPNPDYDRTALASLQREEVAMVTSDLKCEHKHITAVEDKVRTEYERDFREKNADLLKKVPKP